MIKENYFSKKLKNKSDSELRQYIENKKQYQIEAVQAAIWELEKRGNKSEKTTNFGEEIVKENERVEQSKLIQLGIPINTVKPGIRFIHYLIDGFIIIVFIYAINLIPLIEIAHFFAFLLYPFYYVFFEYHFQWTPGKLVSNTIVVDKNGERPNIKSIILRTFARYVPFEAFSCLAENSLGWHDRWSKTYVIDKNDLSILREKKGLNPIKLTALKMSKIAYTLIISFFIVLIISFMFTRSINTRIETEGQVWIANLDIEDKKNILGNWISTNPELKEYYFISNESVICKSNKSTLKNLNYKIENRVLTIFDSEVSVDYVIIQITSSQIQLVESNNPLELIIWKEK